MADKKSKTPEQIAAEEARKEAKRLEQERIQNERAEARARQRRWVAKTRSKVEHPQYGSVIVPHLSKLAAIENAAEFWKCDPLDIIADAKVSWVSEDEGPVRRPKEFYAKGKGDV